MRKHISPGLILGIVAIVIATTGSATAASLITSSKIRNGTIRGKDIHKRTITMDRLSRSVQQAIKKAGPAGATGATGATGAQGQKGEKGDTGATGPTLQPSPGITPTAGNWGIINRNTLGGTAFLRSGPAKPPVGTGSLNLGVMDGTEKVAFGNEVDSFAGGLVRNLTDVGFYVFNVGENIDAGHGAQNMPGITFEIDPNVGGIASNYSSLVFMPDTTSAGWSPYIDATTTGYWGLTGSAFAGTKCDINGARCTWTEVQDYLNDGGDPATILTAAVTKGRDFTFQGAVDGLRINGTVFDFEENGVFTHAA